MALGGVCLVLKDLAQAAAAADDPRRHRCASRGRGAPASSASPAYLVGLALLKGIFQYWMRVIIIGISRDIEYDLRNDLFRHLVRLSPDYYGRTRTGDIMARATNDLNAVRMMLGPGRDVLVRDQPDVRAGDRASWCRVDWRLAMLAILPAPAVSLAVILFGRAHPRPLRAHPGDVLRYLQPRAGEPLGRAHDPRLRAGAGRDCAASRS